jgi:hypothetical protein
VLDVSGPSDWPFILRPKLERRFGFCRVEPRVAFTDEYANGRDVDVGAFEPASIVFSLEPGVEDWGRGEAST